MVNMSISKMILFNSIISFPADTTIGKLVLQTVYAVGDGNNIEINSLRDSRVLEPSTKHFEEKSVDM